MRRIYHRCFAVVIFCAVYFAALHAQSVIASTRLSFIASPGNVPDSLPIHPGLVPGCSASVIARMEQIDGKMQPIAAQEAKKNNRLLQVQGCANHNHHEKIK